MRAARHKFVAGGVLFGEIEDARDVLHLPWSHLEHLLEGRHLIARHDTIGFGHLGAERDHPDGIGSLMVGSEQCAVVLAVEDPIIVVIVAQDGEAREQRGDLAASRHLRIRAEPDDRACQSVPERHPSSPASAHARG